MPGCPWLIASPWLLPTPPLAPLCRRSQPLLRPSRTRRRTAHRSEPSVSHVSSLPPAVAAPALHTRRLMAHGPVPSLTTQIFLSRPPSPFASHSSHSCSVSSLLTLSACSLLVWGVRLSRCGFVSCLVGVSPRLTRAMCCERATAASHCPLYWGRAGGIH